MPRLALFCLLALLTGCVATGASFVKEAPAHEREALIYVFRPSGFIGSEQRPDLKIDGQLAGSVVSGGFLVKRVPLGRHELVLTGGGNPFTWNYSDRNVILDAATSGNYYYRYLPSSSMRAPNTMVHSYSFEQVSEAQALGEMASLSHAQ